MAAARPGSSVRVSSTGGLDALGGTLSCVSQMARGQGRQPARLPDGDDLPDRTAGVVGGRSMPVSPSSSQKSWMKPASPAVCCHPAYQPGGGRLDIAVAARWEGARHNAGPLGPQHPSATEEP
jgi:hypothetical protein